MKRFKGVRPNLSGMKVPPVLDDLYWDLRDRRLLPLAALIVVAIIAVPFLLGGDAEVEPPAKAPTASTSSALGDAEAASLVVVESTPGLRDYRKRLAGRTPTNPFQQHLATPKGTGAQLPEPTGGSSRSAEDGSSSQTITSSDAGGSNSPSAPSTPDDSSSPGSKPSNPPPGDGNGDGNSDGDRDLTLYTFAIDVRIARPQGGNGKQAGKDSAPAIKEKVLPLTALPGEKAPVVTYMGVSKKGKALLMVSNDVKSVFGETKCISGDDVCQLLEAEPGFPVSFVYGNGEAHYTVKVLRIYPVVTGHN